MSLRQRTFCRAAIQWVVGVDWARQADFGVRFEWGPTGAATLAPNSACLVIVDVLSFTTSVTVAVQAGTRVFPYAWRDGTAAEFAARHDAVLAVGRRSATTSSPWSLSPAALRAAPSTARLVLPSPNGSAIAAASQGVPVIAGSLRNATTVAQWLSKRGWGTVERPISVIAAGERWPDGSLRPALEDLLGAGAIIAAIRGRSLSPEARAACACYAATEDVAALVAACASGVELISGGFAQDVAIAAEIDVCDAVPVLAEGAFSDGAH